LSKKFSGRCCVEGVRTGPYVISAHALARRTPPCPDRAWPASVRSDAASFAVATLKTAGGQSLTVTDTVIGRIFASQAGIVVKPAAATQLINGGVPRVTHGVAFSLTLALEDACGNVATGYVGTVHFSSSDSTAALPANYTFTAADAGQHTFTMTLPARMNCN
jgi:hypothetical protein